MCKILETACKMFIKSGVSVGGAQLRYVKTREARGMAFFPRAQNVKILAEFKKFIYIYYIILYYLES
jgi:hypothetical protein